MKDAKDILSFLSRLIRHNDREWFNAHKGEYLEIKEGADAIAQKMIAMISEYEPRVANLKPSDCTYRIYRDTRFSQDKTPYKNHIGIFVNIRGKKAETMGWYLHMQPGGSIFAVGTGWSSPAVLKAIRQGIYDEIDDYREIVETEDFQRAFPILGSDKLKTAPKGFPKDWEYIEYLKPRLHGATVELPDSFFDNPDWLEQLRPAIREGARLNEFYNYFIEEALGLLD